MQVPIDASLLWGGRPLDDVLGDETDALGNAVLATSRSQGRDPAYEDVAPLVRVIVHTLIHLHASCMPSSTTSMRLSRIPFL